MNEFGKELRRFRESRNISQSKFGKKSGYDHSYISRLEFGTRLPRREAVIRFSEALGLSSLEHDILMESAGYLVYSRPKNKLHDYPELLSLSSYLNDITIPKESREAVRNQLKGLVSLIETKV